VIHFVLQTDDKGVFCSDLSHEYILAAETFGLTEEQLLKLSSASVDFCLASPEEKNELRKLFV
jgi:adenosine deaminase